jgi:hypothetical protein
MRRNSALAEIQRRRQHANDDVVRAWHWISPFD